MSRKKSPLVDKICPICNKSFTVARYKKSRTYCSQTCVNEMKHRTYVGRHFTFHKLTDELEAQIVEKYKSGLTAKEIAPDYGVHFTTIFRVIRKHHAERTPSQAKRLMFLLHPEYAINHADKIRGRFKGENSPRWKDGFNSWNDRVKERDNFTCQDCGLRDVELVEAHHIVPKSVAPALRSDISNGITVCPNCHKRRHLALRKQGVVVTSND